MRNTLDKFIDRCLVDEYATKDKQGNYQLNVDDLPEKEIFNFADEIMRFDCKARDEMLINMQNLINERLIKKEIEEGDFFNDDTVNQQMKADGFHYA